MYSITSGSSWTARVRSIATHRSATKQSAPTSQHPDIDSCRRYREWASPHWQDVTESHLDEHLATLYADNAIILFGDDDDHIQSTISQPSFVLRMLDLLQLQPGHTVLELGAGSGWNAALIGQIVGPTGRVYSLEIIPEMAERASASIAELGITNVHVIAADGSNGYAAGAPYDRIVFTAGAHDLPRPFYDQMKPGGLLLMVVKSHGDGDTLFLLEHVGDHFESRDAISCGFVSMTGKHQLDHLASAALEPLRERTAMAAGFRLHVYPADRHLATTGDQWIVRRQESQFLWSP